MFFWKLTEINEPMQPVSASVSRSNNLECEQFYEIFSLNKLVVVDSDHFTQNKIGIGRRQTFFMII